MSILSDRQIRNLCVMPETYYDQADHFRWMEEPRTTTLELRIGETMQQKYERFEREKQPFIKPLTGEIKSAWKPMISPFEPESVRQIATDDSVIENMSRGDGIKYGGVRKVLSFGSTSYGYDVRLQEKIQIFTNINGGEIDPKAISNHCMVEGQIRDAKDGSRYVIMPPHSYLLGVTMEYFKMPRDVLAICLGKSTYARCGAIVNATPIEPGFEGEVVIEIANSTSLPMRIYTGEGISQFLFLQGSEPCEVSYADRGGKYQGQTGMTLGKV